MTGTLVSIYRHPVKGFTPEALETCDLVVGEGVAFDRVYAVENGPSGFDPEAPGHISKQKFTVIAAIPEIAQVRTAYDGATASLRAVAPGRAGFEGRLDQEAGRQAFADWLAGFIAKDVRGPLQVLVAPGTHRFMDHPLGQVSIVNLASVADLAAKVGRPIDPMRFRANLYVDGWPAWAENDWTGAALNLGPARARVFKPIVRCAAIQVDPAAGVRDLELPKALFDNYGHMFCGIYVRVEVAGRLTPGVACGLAKQETLP